MPDWLPPNVESTNGGHECCAHRCTGSDGMHGRATHSAYRLPSVAGSRRQAERGLGVTVSRCHAIFLPPFANWVDQAIVDTAIAAEESGWDGLFLWDQRPEPDRRPVEIADPWVALAAAASSTSRIRLWSMATPLPRRRIVKLARETLTLDRLSRGRLTVGLGTGDDRGREYSAFGEDALTHGDSGACSMKVSEY